MTRAPRAFAAIALAAIASVLATYAAIGPLGLIWDDYIVLRPRHWQELLRVWEAHRRTILFVTHAIDEALLLADRVVVMSSRPGRILDDIEVPFPRPRTRAVRSVAEFGALPKGHARVNQICNWIHDHITYQPGTSDGETTADESLLKRAGVCRDFAHIGTAFCRALGIPARFVSCYAHGLVPSDFHAVFEAYLDGRWWLFDATRQADLDGLVRIGVGRDAAEIAFSTPFGNMQPVNQQVRIQRSDGQGSPMPRTVDAISTEIPAPHAGAA